MAIDEIYEHLKDADFSDTTRFRRIDHPLIAKIQAHRGAMVRIEPPMSQRLSELAARDGRNVEQLVSEALEQYLAAH